MEDTNTLKEQIKTLMVENLMLQITATDIADDLHTDALGPGLLALGIGGLDVESDDQRLLERATFVYDALYAWCHRDVAAPLG